MSSNYEIHRNENRKLISVHKKSVLRKFQVTRAIGQAVNHRHLNAKGSGSLLEEFIQDLWKTKWQWGRIFSEYSRFITTPPPPLYMTTFSVESHKPYGPPISVT